MKFTQRDLDHFFAVAKDPNPIHQTGVVYGMQLLAYLEGVLCQNHHWQHLTQIDYRLTRPLMVDTAFTVAINGRDFVVSTKNGPIGQGTADGQ